MAKIRQVEIPSRLTKAGQQLLPALKEFQTIVNQEALVADVSDVSLSALSQIIAFFYGTDMDVRKDVVMIWAALRRVLNLEATLAERGNEVDLFSDILMLKQPDPINPMSSTNSSARFPPESHQNLASSAIAEPSSVQETIDAAFQDPSKAFSLWQESGKDDQAISKMPLVLKIELHRQEYQREARKWKKLTHKIALDDKITCNGQQYTLYGMIVHCGGLDYHEYYSVLRPYGPGTKWLKYAGETASTRSVEVLTTKQAISDHEGGDSDPESAAVAYIAMYVRTDELPSVLDEQNRKDALRVKINDEKSEKMPKATPFRVGKRDWCAAFELDDIYDMIRGAGHLSRAFYRTEGPTSALRQAQILHSQKAAEYEKVRQEMGEKMVESEKEKAGQESSEKMEDEPQKAVPEEPPAPKFSIFVKQFDVAKQQYTDRGTFTIEGLVCLVPFLREQLWIEKDENWDFYHEHTILVKSKHLIKRSATLFDLSYGEKPWDGVVIIAQRRPTPQQYVQNDKFSALPLPKHANTTPRIKSSEEVGKCLNPIEYSYYLLGDHNPIFYSSHLTNSYFTNPYLSVPLAHGRAHGQGTHIALTGSAYTGPYRCGRKAGPNGTMHYANGDTYTGDWDHDEPHGQGTMTYAKTGNVYTGGWKKRLRFGKGTMQYQVADQQMMLCGVCYEKNMDAVFCFCGHVVACEECARKVDVCPVCREPVKKVVVLKGATGGSGAPSEWGGGKEGGGDIGMIP